MLDAAIWKELAAEDVLGRSDVPTNREITLTRSLNPVPASQLILCRSSSIVAAHRIMSLPSRLNSIRIADYYENAFSRTSLTNSATPGSLLARSRAGNVKGFDLVVGNKILKA